MLFAACLSELTSAWFPHTTNDGLKRIIELLEKGSPLLVHGCFTRAMPQGCLASHIAWHHPQTESLQHDAGIRWLTRVAKLNPATSEVVRAWDVSGINDWPFRSALLEACKAEQDRRENVRPTHDRKTASLMPVTCNS